MHFLLLLSEIAVLLFPLKFAIYRASLHDLDITVVIIREELFHRYQSAILSCARVFLSGKNVFRRETLKQVQD